MYALESCTNGINMVTHVSALNFNKLKGVVQKCVLLKYIDCTMSNSHKSQYNWSYHEICIYDD